MNTNSKKSVVTKTSTVTQLREIAKNLGITGFKKFKKQELIDVINATANKTETTETTAQENSGSKPNDIEMDRDQLRDIARGLGIPIYGQMTKWELSQAIESENARIPTKKEIQKMKVKCDREKN